MNKTVMLGFILFGFLLFSQVGVGAVDYTMIGVENGDSFEFVLDEYEDFDGEKTSNQYYLGWDNEDYEDHYITPGTHFTITIIDAVPDIDEYDDGDSYASILVEYEYNGITFQTDESLLGDMISTTDWAGVRQQLEDEIDEVNIELGSDGTIDISFIDTSSEFGYSIVYDITSTETDNSVTAVLSATINGEVRFDKKTGVLNTGDFSLEFSITNNGKTETERTIERMHRVGYGDEDAGLPLPGFQLIWVSFAMISVVVLIKKRQIIQ